MGSRLKLCADVTLAESSVFILALRSVEMASHLRGKEGREGRGREEGRKTKRQDGRNNDKPTAA
jgi:hypothetical protein